jgi:hypothetical protein
MFETILVLYATDFNWIPLILKYPILNPETWSSHGGLTVPPPTEFNKEQWAKLMFSDPWNDPNLLLIKTNISAWKTSIAVILHSVVAVFASVGGFLIFCQYMQANDQAQKNFIKFLTGLAIIGLAELIFTFFIPAS